MTRLRALLSMPWAHPKLPNLQPALALKYTLNLSHLFLKFNYPLFDKHQRDILPMVTLHFSSGSEIRAQQISRVLTKFN